MGLDPDNYNPFQVSDGTYTAQVMGVETTKKTGEAFVNKEGNRQISVKLMLNGNRRATKYVTIVEDAFELTGLLKALGVTTGELNGAEWHHFLDPDWAGQALNGRTCEVKIKNIPKKDGSGSFMAVNLYPIGTEAMQQAAAKEKENKERSALMAGVANMQRKAAAPTQAPAAVAPKPQGFSPTGAIPGSRFARPATPPMGAPPARQLGDDPNEANDIPY